MASIFCPDCGARATYTLNKPKFCHTLWGASSVKVTASASAAPKEEIEVSASQRLKN